MGEGYVWLADRNTRTVVDPGTGVPAIVDAGTTTYTIKRADGADIDSDEMTYLAVAMDSLGISLSAPYGGSPLTSASFTVANMSETQGILERGFAREYAAVKGIDEKMKVLKGVLDVQLGKYRVGRSVFELECEDGKRIGVELVPASGVVISADDRRKLTAALEAVGFSKVDEGFETSYGHMVLERGTVSELSHAVDNCIARAKGEAFDRAVTSENADLGKEEALRKKQSERDQEIMDLRAKDYTGKPLSGLRTRVRNAQLTVKEYKRDKAEGNAKLKDEYRRENTATGVKVRNFLTREWRNRT